MLFQQGCFWSKIFDPGLGLLCFSLSNILINNVGAEYERTVEFAYNNDFSSVPAEFLSFTCIRVRPRAVESESRSRNRKDFQPEESESESQMILTTPTPGRLFAHQLWLFVSQTCVSVTLGNLSSLTLQQEMIMAIQTGGSALTCIPSLWRHYRSAASLGLVMQPTLCECNRSGLVSLEFPFAHSGWHYRCSVTLATQQWMRVLMGARPLLRNARHRTMITPVNPPRLRLIHISPSYQTVYRSFEIILEWVLSIGLEFKSNVVCKPIASKKHSIWY